MPQSHYLDEMALKALFNGDPFPAPSPLYVALFTTAPSKAGGGVEVSGSGYARLAVPATGANWSVTGPTWFSRNLLKLSFGTATGGAWGLVAAIGIFDAVTGGNLLYYGTVSSAKQVDDGDPVVILPDNLAVGGSL